MTARLGRAGRCRGVRVVDDDGAERARRCVEHGGRSVTWLARDVPSLGWRTYRLGRRVDSAGLGASDGGGPADRERRTTGSASTPRAAAVPAR